MDEDKYQHNVQYSNTLLQGLKSLYEESQLCDIVIKVGERDFPAHKAVLAATSSYFKAMFSSGFKESQQRAIKIDGNPEAFGALLEFMYTGRLDVTKVKKHMFDMFQMSLYMDFKDCSWSCSEVLSKLIRSECVTVDEVCQVLFLARDHDSDDDGFWDRSCASQDFLMNNLAALQDTEEFMQNATMKFLEEFLGDEDLAYEEEEKQVLELVVNWLKFNWEERQGYAPQLLQKVRLGLVSTDDMKELIGPEIYAIPGCSELLSKVEKLRDSGKSKYTLATEELELFATRSSITTSIVAAKQDRYPREDSIHFYDDGWWEIMKNFAPLPELIHLSLIVADGRLFVAGKNYSRDSADLHRYDAEENKWISLPSVSKNIEYSKMVYLDGFIYIIGGGFKSAEVVERYDVSENRWEKVQQLPVYARAISVVAFKGRILCSVLYMGVNPDVNHYKLLIYHPGRDVWQEIAVLKEWGSSSTSVDILTSRVFLFIHKEQCYRIVKHKELKVDANVTISVKLMNVQVCDDGEVICTIKDEIMQDPKPEGKNMFRIHDEEFVCGTGNDRGYDSIYRTGKDFNGHKMKMSSNIVMFTFDKQKFL